ncbi:ribosomal-protein-alanine N-acetyltransferase [Bacillus oleivorans]|uniref:Ribosomal-protein-alanine N-acetyltransferase n=1 Tax=Bacillus oleivorans TaxID=1448271 RepID=A0A285D576_9BACI|nr:GNAT family protein [Bacillus oleivorans]SNX74825.1 ribosomal-protein-alanine N-acetyltransferase [Bacillus oleivorans]
MLKGNNIYLRFFEESDTEELLALELRNKDFFKKYNTTKKDSFYTLDGQLQRIQRTTEMRENDQFYLFGIFLKETDKLIGVVMLSEVGRGPFQNCWLGYYLDQSHNGKGYMTEAVRIIVDYAFAELNLHRIDAGVMPHNVGSIRLLEKNGFHKEGIAKKNVLINGVWEDHQTMAIINENWRWEE